ISSGSAKRCGFSDGSAFIESSFWARCHYGQSLHNRSCIGLCVQTLSIVSRTDCQFLTPLVLKTIKRSKRSQKIWAPGSFPRVTSFVTSRDVLCVWETPQET